MGGSAPSAPPPPPPPPPPPVIGIEVPKTVERVQSRIQARQQRAAIAAATSPDTQSIQPDKISVDNRGVPLTPAQEQALNQNNQNSPQNNTAELKFQNDPKLSGTSGSIF